MQSIPLVVLAREGPQARAYLARLRRAGLRPERVVLAIDPRHPASRKRLGRWLPRGLRARYAARVQDAAQNHWPRRIRRAAPGCFDAVARGMETFCEGAAELLDEIGGLFAWERYAERVERVVAAELEDTALAGALARLAPCAVLFTGGGILRESLLGLPEVRFLHVHPGHLPHVRGADGLLWSVLLRGRPGLSCFYMARGIDTGPLIVADDLPPLHFDLGETPRPDDRTLYRALFSYVDPLLRAEFLARRVLPLGGDPARLPATPQDPDRGVTYHFLHPRLRAAALARIFRGGRGQPAANTG